MNDATKIYELYVENAAAQNEQPKMTVDEHGNKYWFLHGELHRDDAPAIEYANGAKRWYQHGQLHRVGEPAVVAADGSKQWYQRDDLHREDGAAVEWADGDKEWCLHGKHYEDANKWAQAVLKMHNKPHDAEAVQKYLRHLFTKDDLI
jgi:hypothetical protein